MSNASQVNANNIFDFAGNKQPTKNASTYLHILIYVTNLYSM